MNVFVKPDEQSQARLGNALFARKRLLKTKVSPSSYEGTFVGLWRYLRWPMKVSLFFCLYFACLFPEFFCGDAADVDDCHHCFLHALDGDELMGTMEVDAASEDVGTG